MHSQPCVLTIAGSDSGGGAGIQADLKTITMLGGFGMSVITALTAQNSMGVTGIHAPDADFVGQQLDAVLGDFPVAAAKTGMLFSGATIEAVCQRIEKRNFPLVVDPVCVSQSGHRLLQDEAVDVIRKRLIPQADLFTPNRPEAELLTDMTIDTEADVEEAIEKLIKMGAKAVLLKGGHFEGSRMIDWLGVAGQKPVALEQPKVDTVHTHGTGCTLSAAIATGLAKGLPVEEAVAAAQEYMNLALRAGFGPGQGYGPPNHSVPLLRLQARERILSELGKAAGQIVATANLSRLMPESRMNIACAVPHACTTDDVAAFAGRITTDHHGRVYIPGAPEFGASYHTANVVLSAAAICPEISAAAVIRVSDAVTASVGRSGLKTVWFDRKNAPEGLDEQDKIVNWGIQAALSGHPEPEEVAAVCDTGAAGAEGFVRILGRSVQEVLERLQMIAESLE